MSESSSSARNAIPEFKMPTLQQVQKMRLDMKGNYVQMVNKLVLKQKFLSDRQSITPRIKPTNHNQEYGLVQAIATHYTRHIPNKQFYPEEFLERVFQTIKMQTIYSGSVIFKIEPGQQIKDFKDNLDKFNAKQPQFGTSLNFWQSLETDFKKVQELKDKDLEKFRKQNFNCNTYNIMTPPWIQFFGELSTEKELFVHDVNNLEIYFKTRRDQMKEVYDFLLQWSTMNNQIKKMLKYQEMQKQISESMRGMILDQQYEMQDKLLFNLDNDIMRCFIQEPDLGAKGYMSQFVLSQTNQGESIYDLKVLKSVPPQSLGLETTHYMSHIKLDEVKVSTGYNKRACLSWQKFNSEMLSKVPFFEKNAYTIIGSYIDPSFQRLVNPRYFSILHLKERQLRATKNIKDYYLGDYVSGLYTKDELDIMKNRTNNVPSYFGGQIVGQKNERYVVVSYELDFQNQKFDLKGIYEPQENGTLILNENNIKFENVGIKLKSMENLEFFEESIYGNQKTGQYLFDQQNLPWLFNYLVAHYNFVRKIHEWLNNKQVSTKENLTDLLKKNKLFCKKGVCQRFTTAQFTRLENQLRRKLGEYFNQTSNGENSKTWFLYQEEPKSESQMDLEQLEKRDLSGLLATDTEDIEFVLNAVNEKPKDSQEQNIEQILEQVDQYFLEEEKSKDLQEKPKPKPRIEITNIEQQFEFWQKRILNQYGDPTDVKLRYFMQYQRDKKYWSGDKKDIPTLEQFEALFQSKYNFENADQEWPVPFPDNFDMVQQLVCLEEKRNSQYRSGREFGAFFYNAENKSKVLNKKDNKQKPALEIIQSQVDNNKKTISVEEEMLKEAYQDQDEQIADMEEAEFRKNYMISLYQRGFNTESSFEFYDKTGYRRDQQFQMSFESDSSSESQKEGPMLSEGEQEIPANKPQSPIPIKKMIGKPKKETKKKSKKNSKKNSKK